MLKPALDLVRELRQLGAEFDAAGGVLQITAPAGVLTGAIKAEIAARKPDILALFSESLRLLNERGVRIIRRERKDVFALWADADCQEVRNALEALGHDRPEVLHLDDPDLDIPHRYREHVPKLVQEKWERSGLFATPDERLEAEKKAHFLNRMFDAFGTSPRRSRITAATVLHGMLARKQRNSQ